jgi:hypothetical protein
MRCIHILVFCFSHFSVGIIGGRGVGLARNVTLVDVQVMDRSGVGRSDAILRGMDYIAGR